MISRALLNAPFFIPKDADLLRNRKVNTKKRQNRHLPELAFLILGTYFTAPIFTKNIHKISVLWIQEIPEFMPLAYDISFQPFIKRDIKTISIWSWIA